MKLKTIYSFNEIEQRIANHAPANFKLNHYFSDGIYTREITMIKDSIVMTMKHKMSSPFFIMRGHVAVLRELEDGAIVQEAIYKGGDHGTTKIGTRRLLWNIEETVWITCHPNPDNEMNVDILTNRLVERPNNPLVDNDDDSVNQWRIKNRLSIGGLI